MQLNHEAAPDAAIDWTAPDSGADVPPNAAVRKYETRRCHVSARAVIRRSASVRR